MPIFESPQNLLIYNMVSVSNQILGIKKIQKMLHLHCMTGFW
jgi:hypothetical protein